MNSTNASNSDRVGSNSLKNENLRGQEPIGQHGKLLFQTHTLKDAYQIQADLNFEEDDEREHTLEDQVNQIVASPYQDLFYEPQDSLESNSVQSHPRKGQAEQLLIGQKFSSEYPKQHQAHVKQMLPQDNLEGFGTQMPGEFGQQHNNLVYKAESRFNGPVFTLVPSSNTAFKLFSKGSQRGRIGFTPQFQSDNDVQKLIRQTEETVADFRISENIMKIFTTEQKPQEIEVEQSKRCKRREGNLLPRLLTKLVETMQKCNPRYGYLPLLNPKRDLTIPCEGVYNNGYDNIECDYILRVGDHIVTPEGKEFEILDLMGKGTFGQVVKCENKQAKELVAIKVIKNKKAFKNQGVIEIKILDIVSIQNQKIQLNRVYDPNGESPLVRMLDFFVFRDHLCIVFELLSESLYDLIKDNQFQGLSLNFSRLIISNILEGMKVIKEARLIHCDLKPENILFKSRDNLNLKIIDLGSACFEGFAIFQYIQSRYYRSPEVLLGLPYDSAIDMWSLGCICAELFLGIPIFPGNSEYDQLSRIIELLGLPSQHLIQKCRNRDKYFYFCEQTQQFRFKTFEEFQYSTGIRLEIPKKYIQLCSLNDLKVKFIQKKSMMEYEKAQREGRQIDPTNFQPQISESEINSMDAFIDFLKGVLRIDKDTRWTPNMAMEHPFIKRQHYGGPFDPVRDQEKNSTNETGEDTMSEQSSSSRDSKEYKYGSCPSKILYPQTASLPQYLQSQQTQNFGGGGVGGQHAMGHTSTGMGDGADFVFHGGSIQANQSHRPPILSIPDEFFKGFMFGRLDQILSMTREQLYQFLSEQNEIIFRQHAQKVMMQQKQMFMIQQQQQQQYQQQLQFMMMNQNQVPMNPMQPMMQPHMINQLPNQQQKPQFMGVPQIPFPGMQQYGMPPPGFNAQGPQIQPMNQPGSFEAQVRLNAAMQQQMGAQQIGVGGGQFIQGPTAPQWMFNQQHQNGPPQNFYQQQMPQKYMVPPEQIIFNPPPYQKQQVFLNTTQLNDPQYQQMLLQQQQKRNQGNKNQRFSAPGAQTNLTKGKAGSWQPNAGIQGHKYNQYYNQINNPGQIIGRAGPNDQAQQFAYFAQAQANQPFKKQQQDPYQIQEENNQQFPVGSFSKNEFRKEVQKKKHGKFTKNFGNQEFGINQTIPEEEKSRDQVASQFSQALGQDQFFGGKNLQGPYYDPQQAFVNQGYQRDMQSIQEQNQFQQQQQQYQNQMIQQNMMYQQDQLQNQQIHQQQPALHHQLNQKVQLNVGAKAFQSPKFQQQDPNSFISTQKSKSMSIQQQQQQMQQVTQITNQKLSQFAAGPPPGLIQKLSTNSLHNQSVDGSQNLNSSFQSNQGNISSYGQKSSGQFLKQIEQTANQRQQQTGQPNQEKQLFNHHYPYHKHMMGLNQPGTQQSFLSNTQSNNNSVILSQRNRSNSDQVEDPLNTSNLSQTQIQQQQLPQGVGGGSNQTFQNQAKEYKIAPGQHHFSRNQIKFQISANDSFQNQDNYGTNNSVDYQDDNISSTSQKSATKLIGFEALKEQIKKQSIGPQPSVSFQQQQQQPPHSAKGSQHFRFDNFNPNAPDSFNFPQQVSQNITAFTPQNFKKSQNQQASSFKQGSQTNQSAVRQVNPTQYSQGNDQGLYQVGEQSTNQQRTAFQSQPSQEFTNMISYDDSHGQQRQNFNQLQQQQVYNYPQTNQSYEYQVQHKQQQYMTMSSKGMHSQSSFKDLTPIDEDQNLAAAMAGGSHDELYRSFEHQKEADQEGLRHHISSQIFSDSEDEAQSQQSDEEDN